MGELKQEDTARHGRKLRYCLFPLICLLLILGMGMTVYCGETEELYTDGQKPVYGSADDLKNAVTSLYGKWDNGLEGCELSYEDYGVTVTLKESAYSAYKDMSFQYIDGNAVGYIRYETKNRRDFDAGEVERMVRFTCCLLSGDPGEFPEEVGRGVSEVIKKDSNQIRSRYWFKRINGYNCPYECLAANESLPEGLRSNSQFTMQMSPYEMKCKIYENMDGLTDISLSELMAVTVDRKSFSKNANRYRVRGNMHSIAGDEKGSLSGILTDGTNSVPVLVNGMRNNTIDEYERGTVFYLEKLPEEYREMYGTEYIILFCR